MDPARDRPPLSDDPAAAAGRLVACVGGVIRSQDEAVELAAVAYLAGGHLLIEGLPGVGKTVLARALAAATGGEFKRVQATPDLMPTDVTGLSVYDQRSQRFEFVPGPVFANVLLVDELNRTTPRTQSCLMEAMDESRVTVEGASHPLPDPFFLVATQNPVEHHGTYPLPEGQLDRFALVATMGRLEPEQERRVVREQLVEHPLAAVQPALAPGEVRAARARVRAVHVGEAVLDYVLALVGATRSDPRVALGASARGSALLTRCAQARALLEGRDFVLPDDVKALAVAALAHRLVLPTGESGAGPTGRAVVEDLLDSVPVPLAAAPGQARAAG